MYTEEVKWTSDRSPNSSAACKMHNNLRIYTNKLQLQLRLQNTTPKKLTIRLTSALVHQQSPHLASMRHAADRRGSLMATHFTSTIGTVAQPSSHGITPKLKRENLFYIYMHLPSIFIALHARLPRWIGLFWFYVATISAPSTISFLHLFGVRYRVLNG